MLIVADKHLISCHFLRSHNEVASLTTTLKAHAEQAEQFQQQMQAELSRSKEESELMHNELRERIVELVQDNQLLNEQLQDAHDASASLGTKVLSLNESSLDLAKYVHWIQPVCFSITVSVSHFGTR